MTPDDSKWRGAVEHPRQPGDGSCPRPGRRGRRPVDEIAAALTDPGGRRVARGELLRWAAPCPLLAEGYEVDVLAGLLAD